MNQHGQITGEGFIVVKPPKGELAFHIDRGTTNWI
jgi:hypothetical protein